MCVVSAIHDYGRPWIEKDHPWVNPQIPWKTKPSITRKEFDELVAKIAELERLIKAAADFDAATGQPGCELAPKTKWFRELRERVALMEKKLAQKSAKPKRKKA